MVVVWGGGKARMAGPQTGTWEGGLHFMTQAPKLAWLNNSTGWREGQGNLATGVSSGKIYAKKQHAYNSNFQCRLFFPQRQRSIRSLLARRIVSYGTAGKG